jgi:DNA-binding CsgD family transcriptional regulator
MTWYKLGKNSVVSARIALETPTKPSRSSLDILWFGLRNVLDKTRLAHHASLLANAIDAESSTIILFDHGCEIVYANAAADHLLSRQTETPLTAVTDGYKKRPLVGLLCTLAERIRESNDTYWRGELRISDGSSLQCEVRSVEGQEASDPGGSWVVLRSTERSEREFLESFAVRYKLSPREAQVLRHLVDGENTETMAEALGISLHTIRDHIKRLHKKTGASSRNELLSLVAVAAMSQQPEFSDGR